MVRAGRGVTELARKFGCNSSSIHHWINAAVGPSNVGSGGALSTEVLLSTSERQELLELRRKLEQIQLERDLLAKATNWFADKRERTFTTSSNS